MNPAGNNKRISKGTMPDWLKPHAFKKGKSGNPDGRPKDTAALIARRLFEQNPQAVVDAFKDKLRKKSKACSKTFDIMANRAYGRVAGDTEPDGPTVIVICSEVVAK